MKLTLRPMEFADIERVAQIDAAAFGSGGWPESAFHDELAQNRLARYFVLDPGAGGALVGYLGCWALVDEVHLVTMAVEPAQQRRGLGEALVLHVLDLAHGLGADQVSLECRASNSAALALYRKYDFRQVGRHERYYADNQEDALVLTAHGVAGSRYRARLRRLREAHAARYALQVRVPRA